MTKTMQAIMVEAEAKGHEVQIHTDKWAESVFIYLPGFHMITMTVYAGKKNATYRDSKARRNVTAKVLRKML